MCIGYPFTMNKQIAEKRRNSSMSLVEWPICWFCVNEDIWQRPFGPQSALGSGLCCIGKDIGQRIFRSILNESVYCVLVQKPFECSVHHAMNNSPLVHSKANSSSQ